MGLVLLASPWLFGCDSSISKAQTTSPAEIAKIEHINPEGLAKNPAYSQAVSVSGPVRTVYVGGQNAVDASGQLIGANDVGAQADQIFRNVEVALTAAGGKLEHVVKWNVYIVQGQSLPNAFQAYQKAWADRGPPGVVTAAVVAGLALPGALLEVDAVAAIPLDEPR